MIPIQINKTGEENLFTIPINYFEIVGIDNKKLAKEILGSQVRLSEDKNICLYHDTVFDLNTGEQSKALLTAIQALAKQSGLQISKVWSQIHHPRESTDIHNHSDAQMAFIYYVAVPSGSGDLVFLLEDACSRYLPPTESRLCIFPSWVKHKVSKNTGEELRISVAGNLVKSDFKGEVK